MDLVDGESELLSGFNVEYLGVEFALIFISWIWDNYFFLLYDFIDV